MGVAAGIAVAVVGLGLSAYGMSESESNRKRTQSKASRDIAFAREREKDAAYLQQQLLPFQLDQMGLEGEYTSTGALLRVKKRADTPEEARSKEVRRLAEERVLKGLRGELDVDPASTRRFNQDQRNREEYLARTLGPGRRALSVASRAAGSRRAPSAAAR